MVSRPTLVVSLAGDGYGLNRIGLVWRRGKFRFIIGVRVRLGLRNMIRVMS